MFKIGKKTQKKSFKTQFLHGYFFFVWLKKRKQVSKISKKNAQFTLLILLRRSAHVDLPRVN